MSFSPLSLILRFMAYLPFSFSRTAGRFFGRLVWWRNGNSARVSLTNIRLCFPSLSLAQQRKLARSSLEETGRMALETPAIWYRGNQWRPTKVVRWEAPELFNEALAADSGLIVLIPHLGNWEMAGMIVSAQRPTTILYREPRVAQLNDLLRELRNVGTANLVPANSKGVMAVLKALRGGGMTMILPDQEPATQGGIFSPFFNIPAYSMTLVHRLHQKTSAKILFAYAKPEKNGFVMGFCEPEEAIYSASEQESVDAMNRTIEKLVRVAPECYQWEYKRFRKRPAGEEKLYPKT